MPLACIERTSHSYAMRFTRVSQGEEEAVFKAKTQCLTRITIAQ